MWLFMLFEGVKHQMDAIMIFWGWVLLNFHILAEKIIMKFDWIACVATVITGTVKF